MNILVSTATALAMAAAGDVAALFSGYNGVYRYGEFTGGWLEIKDSAATAVAMDGAGDVFAQITGVGVEFYNESTLTWLATPITTLTGGVLPVTISNRCRQDALKSQ